MADTPEDTLPEERASDGAAPANRDDDARSDIEQAVAARSDAVERGEGGPEPETFTASGLPDGPAGTGGVVKNQEHDQQ